MIHNNGYVWTVFIHVSLVRIFGIGKQNIFYRFDDSFFRFTETSSNIFVKVFLISSNALGNTNGEPPILCQQLNNFRPLLFVLRYKSG